MDREAHLRSLLDFPAIVVAYFTGPQTVQAALADVNRQQDEANPPNGLPADRALLMIELRYLDAKARATPSKAPSGGGWLESLKGMFGGGQAKNGSK